MNWKDLAETKTDQRTGWASLLGVAVILMVLSVVGANVSAEGFKTEEAKEWTFAFDSTVTLSGSMRVSGRDCNQISSSNGGCNTVPDPIINGTLNGRLLNSDDGNLNVDKKDVYSIQASVVHEAQFDWRNFGAFGRVTYFYDIVQDNDLGHQFPPQRTDLSNDARYRTDNPWEGGTVGRGFRILDLYGYTNFDIGENPWDLRIGNQVINWGEEYYTQGGIKATNALDVTKLRVAGSELKEGLIPAPIMRLSGVLAGDLTFDGYYQFDWNRTEADPVGTFYSTSDLVSRGAEGQFIGVDPGSGLVDRDTLVDFYGLTVIIDQASPGGIRRLSDDEAKSQGQWGASLRYYASSIETEFAAFYMRFHDKAPTVSFRGDGLGGQILPPAFFSGSAGYYVEYLEDIDLAGVSFSTVLGGVALSGEASYRDNQPTPITSAFGSAVPSWAASQPASARGAVREKRVMTILNGVYVVGPATPVLGPVNNFLRSDDMAIVAEVGYMKYPDLDHSIAYAPPAAIAIVTKNGKPWKPDENSWGYTVRVSNSYARAFGSAVTLTPSVTYIQDVKGTTPDAGTSYTEDRKKVALQLTADYQNTWKGILTYSNSFQGGKANGGNDRDFVQVSLSYAF